MDITIAQVKAWREEIGASHLVVFAVDRDGRQQVATHGETELDAQEAATAGNKLKASLGWPADLCRAKPLERICRNCVFYHPDYGIHCVNGWSKDGSSGWCLLQPAGTIRTQANRKCAAFEPRA